MPHDRPLRWLGLSISSHPPRLRHGFIKTFDQVHAPLKQRLVRNPLLRPSDKSPIQPHSLHPPEFFISYVSVMDHLCHGCNPAPAYCELLPQCLEGAVVASMAEAFGPKHVKRNGLRVLFGSCAEHKLCIGINEPPN